MANSAPISNIPLEKFSLNALSYSINPVNQTERITCLGMIQQSQARVSLPLKLWLQECNDKLET